ncbi:NADPH-dependent diflavin oxidoreductase 1-like isoform X1 [Clavelina lepadiformis]|uniref:NADPH-dependent diflavin oxidoreductase 1-like isoform X1 n=2 Tax=Clavelina lepadiformis TaxID=159417 RepID=UPI004042B2D5
MTKDHQHPILVLYGSQTGTAEEVCERIVMQSRGSNFSCSCMALDDYNIEDLVNAEVAVFVCSTTGQGEPPDNMKKFWRFIMRKNLPPTCLADLKFGVLGLGDSSYAKYNFVAKKLCRRLENLGADPLLKLGLADDQHDWGPDAVVDPWVTEMWQKLINLHPVDEQYTSPLGSSLPPPGFNVKMENGNSSLVIRDQLFVNGNGMKQTYNRKHPFLAPVKSNTRVTSVDHFQETRLLSFDVSAVSEELAYEPGDVVMIQPSNVKADVEEFLSALPFVADTPMVFEATTDCDFSIAIPKPVTLRELAKNYLDFMSVPRRSFFQLLAHVSSDELEKEKLTEFGSPEGTEERYDYANRPRRTILEVLQDFHKTSREISLERIFDIFPIIRPRAFSIASSPSKHKGELHVLVAVVKYKTRLSHPRKGLCSNWLSTLKPLTKAPIWIKRGGIRFSRNAPCIMVGPGTGIAPFRSAAHERSSSYSQAVTVVFFGCRGKAADYYFEEEWKTLPVKFFAAFSRDQEEKVYVQHNIKENAVELWNLIKHKNACVFVAGNSKNMPDDVKSAFLDIFQAQGNMTSEEAQYFYEELQRNKRYQQETWS